MPTLLTPFATPSHLPAILTPATSPTPNLTLSHAQLGELIDSVRSQLEGWEGGLAVGDVVSMSLINSVEFAAAFLGVGAHRCIAAPLNPTYNPSEVSFYLQDTKSSLLLLPHGATTSTPLHPAAVAAKELGVPVAEILFDGRKVGIKFASGGKKGGKVEEGRGPARENDVALVLHTSGTTGKPKAVPLSHLNLATTMQNIVNTYHLTAHDRTYLVMPLFHVHGLLAGFLAPLLSGGSIVVPPKFAASTFWSEFITAKCNWYTAVPTIHQILLASPHPSPVPSIRFIRSCSSALSPTTLYAVEEAFGAPVLEAYAMTEAAHQMTSNPLPPLKHKPGTVGLGQGVSIKILSLTDDSEVEEGEVAILGQNVTSGYLNNPKANAEAFTPQGYFRTGDRGRKDEDGYLVLTGRLKELINRGGEKISPLEVDNALLSVEGVAEAVAFGVADKMMGEKVWSAVVLKPGKESMSEKDVLRLVREKISAFKCPERVFILKAIPKGPTGKIQRKALATKFMEENPEKESSGRKSKL